MIVLGFVKTERAALTIISSGRGVVKSFSAEPLIEFKNKKEKVNKYVN